LLNGWVANAFYRGQGGWFWMKHWQIVADKCICNIGKNIFCFTIAKYLPMSAKDESYRRGTKCFCLAIYKILKC